MSALTTLEVPRRGALADFESENVSDSVLQALFCTVNHHLYQPFQKHSAQVTAEKVLQLCLLFVRAKEAEDNKFENATSSDDTKPMSHVCSRNTFTHFSLHSLVQCEKVN